MSQDTLFALAHGYVSTEAGSERLKRRLGIADREIALLSESTAARVGLSSYMAMAYAAHAVARGAVGFLVSPGPEDQRPAHWYVYEIGVGAIKPCILVGPSRGQNSTI